MSYIDFFLFFFKFEKQKHILPPKKQEILSILISSEGTISSVHHFLYTAYNTYSVRLEEEGSFEE